MNTNNCRFLSTTRSPDFFIRRKFIENNLTAKALYKIQCDVVQ